MQLGPPPRIHFFPVALDTFEGWLSVPHELVELPPPERYIRWQLPRRVLLHGLGLQRVH